MHYTRLGFNHIGIARRIVQETNITGASPTLLAIICLLKIVPAHPDDRNIVQNLGIADILTQLIRLQTIETLIVFGVMKLFGQP